MAKGNSELDTPGKVFAYWNTLPEMRHFVEQCYYDDVLLASGRFYKSDEFKELQEITRLYLGDTTGRLLDVGGGNGMASIAWQRAGFEVILVEPDDDPMVGYGTLKSVTDIPIISAYGERLPIPDGSIDIVYVRQVLHHLADLPSFMQEIHRVLRSRGVFIATREHVISKISDLELFHHKHPVHQYTGSENAYLLNDYVDSMKSAGFVVKKTLGPVKSPINYGPTNKAEFSHSLVTKLGRYISKPLAELIVHTPQLKSFLLSCLSWRDQTAGRLYSFVCIKP